MNKYYAASCSHLLGGYAGRWGQAARAMSSILLQSHPKRHFPRVGCPCRAGKSSEHRQLLGLGVWAGVLGWGIGLGLWAWIFVGALGRDFGWGFGQGFKLGLRAAFCCSKGTSEPGQGQPVLHVQNCEQTAKSLNLRGQLEIFLTCRGGILPSRHQMLLIFRVHF